VVGEIKLYNEIASIRKDRCFFYYLKLIINVHMEGVFHIFHVVFMSDISEVLQSLHNENTQILSNNN